MEFKGCGINIQVDGQDFEEVDCVLLDEMTKHKLRVFTYIHTFSLRGPCKGHFSFFTVINKAIRTSKPTYQSAKYNDI